MPKEVVSPQVVANWFANKRKEIRRRSQENQADVCAAPALARPSSSNGDEAVRVFLVSHQMILGFSQWINAFSS